MSQFRQKPFVAASQLKNIKIELAGGQTERRVQGAGGKNSIEREAAAESPRKAGQQEQEDQRSELAQLARIQERGNNSRTSPEVFKRDLQHGSETNMFDQ